jgi:predicted small lipoprotein YifL
MMKEKTMSRFFLFLVLAALAGCGTNHYVPLPTVHADDPVRQLNPGRWDATVNDLMTPPEMDASNGR